MIRGHLAPGNRPANEDPPGRLRAGPRQAPGGSPAGAGQTRTRPKARPARYRSRFTLRSSHTGSGASRTTPSDPKTR